ncbi:MAG: ROK family protein [Planctomycetales bacterium]|nr:ROK family protein [Planctomycetales bacterium]
MKLWVGIDVGGTTSTVTVGDANRQGVYVSPQFETRSTAGPAAVIEAVVAAVQQGVAEAGGALADVASVCLSTPGPATLDGLLLKTPNLDPAMWDKFPIRQALEEALRAQVPTISVHYIGDGQAAVLGEFAVRSGKLTWPHARGAGGQDLQSIFMVIVGTGLGGGEVRDGRVVRGREGRAGHVGHILLPEYAFRYPHDRQLQVGNALSTAESAISLTGLSHQLGYRLTLDEWKDNPLVAAPGTVRDKAKKLRELAAAGDPLAQQLFDDQAKALGIALLSVNYLGDFDLIVIGGGVSDLAPAVRDRYRQLAEESYRTHALDGFRNLDRFEFSICGDEAPVAGALVHAYEATAP